MPYHLGVDVTFALEVEREERNEEILHLVDDCNALPLGCRCGACVINK